MIDQYELIIPMTGLGQRFVDCGYIRLKPLIETGIGTMLEGVLSNFKSIKSPHFIISMGHEQKQDLRNEIIKFRPDARIHEIPAHKLGPSYAVYRIKNKLNLELPAIVNYCDFSGIWSENELLYRSKLQDGLILTYTGFHPHLLRSNSFAYVRKNESNEVCDIQEKMPFTNYPETEEASTGTYVFKSAKILIDSIDQQIKSGYSYNGEFYTSLSYKPMIEKGMIIKTMQISKFFQWGTPEDLQDFRFWVDVKEFNFSQKSEISNDNGIILAAGSGTRLKGLTQNSKPFVSVFGKTLWNFSASVIQNCRNQYVFIREEERDMFEKSSRSNLNYLTTSVQTRSQAESALHALRLISRNDYPVHLLACDNILLNVDLTKFTNYLRKYKVAVWTCKDYPIAKANPEQFTWVGTNSAGEINAVYIKAKNPPKEASVVIGNFSFASVLDADNMVSKILNETYNHSEVYLDFIIEYCIKSNIEIIAVDIERFSSVGSELELNTLEYWQEAFANWKY